MLETEAKGTQNEVPLLTLENEGRTTDSQLKGQSSPQLTHCMS